MRWNRALLLTLSASGVAIAACSAFGGSDSSEGGVRGDSGAPNDAVVGADGGSVQGDAGASPDTGADSGPACTLKILAAVADTWFDLQPGCNAPLGMNKGKLPYVLVANTSGHQSESAIVQFDLTMLPKEMQDAVKSGASNVSMTVTFTRDPNCNSDCASTGPGNVMLSSMRSDWSEGVTASDGADYCQRMAGDGGWSGSGGAFSGSDVGGAVASTALDAGEPSLIFSIDAGALSTTAYGRGPLLSLVANVTPYNTTWRFGSRENTMAAPATLTIRLCQ